jgi:septum formation protein
VSKTDSQIELILASSSPFRRRLLEQLSIKFRIVEPNIDESPLEGENPQTLVRRLSVEKAHAVASKAPMALIIGSDQVAVNQGTVVGKPKSHTEAVAQLLSSSGKTITLYTGIALLNSNTGHVQTDVVPFEVGFRSLTREIVERYLEREKPYGSCNSLQVDGLGIALLEHISGKDPSGLIGLPLTVLVRMLEKEEFLVI